MFPLFWAGFGFPPPFPSHLAVTGSDGYGLSSPSQRQAVLHRTLPSFVTARAHGRAGMGMSPQQCQPWPPRRLCLTLIMTPLTMTVLPSEAIPGRSVGQVPGEKLWQATGAVLEVTCPWRQHCMCGAQGGLIPQQAEKRSHTNDSARNQNFVCLLSSIHCTVCIQIPIQISLKLKYWIIQCKQLCETQTSWLITLWLPLTHRNNLTPWVHVPNHTWNWVSYTTS